jgi:hypothetical protein
MNLDFIKKKLDTLQGKNKSSTKFWKPPEGESKIRILPYKHNPENPFVELKFYYYRSPNGAAKTYLSPSINGNPDPVLEFCEKLRATGTKENWVLSKSLEPKMRTYVPIIVRGKEEEGVKWWGFGKQVYEAILEKMSNPDIGDITDLESGNDVIVKFTKVPGTGKKFPETKVDVRIKKTPAVDPTNDVLLQKIQEQDNVVELFTEPTYEELKREFENHTNPENDSSSEQDAAETEAANDDTTAPLNEAPTTATTTPTAPATTPESSPSPTAEKAAVNLSPEEMKAKFKKMFTEAANAK